MAWKKLTRDMDIPKGMIIRDAESQNQIAVANGGGFGSHANARGNAIFVQTVPDLETAQGIVEGMTEDTHIPANERWERYFRLEYYEGE
jgi:hypothetical protein